MKTNYDGWVGYAMAYCAKVIITQNIIFNFSFIKLTEPFDPTICANHLKSIN